jgi:hypothetical protein
MTWEHKPVQQTINVRHCKCSTSHGRHLPQTHHQDRDQTNDLARHAIDATMTPNITFGLRASIIAPAAKTRRSWCGR